MLRPEPARTQLPAIDNIADQINGLGIVITQKVEKLFGLAAARTEMYIRDEQSTEFSWTVRECHPYSRP
jgi:2-keto-4-pentenoate hydratase